MLELPLYLVGIIAVTMLSIGVLSGIHYGSKMTQIPIIEKMDSQIDKTNKTVNDVVIVKEQIVAAVECINHTKIDLKQITNDSRKIMRKLNKDRKFYHDRNQELIDKHFVRVPKR